MIAEPGRVETRRGLRETLSPGRIARTEYQIHVRCEPIRQPRAQDSRCKMRILHRNPAVDDDSRSAGDAQPALPIRGQTGRQMEIRDQREAAVGLRDLMFLEVAVDVLERHEPRWAHVSDLRRQMLHEPVAEEIEPDAEVRHVDRLGLKIRRELPIVEEIPD